jgi:hypothetical protein
MALVCDLDIFLFFRQSILIEERVDQAARPDKIVFQLLLIPPFDLPELGTVAGNPTDAFEYIVGVLAMAGRHIDQKWFWIGTK